MSQINTHLIECHKEQKKRYQNLYARYQNDIKSVNFLSGHRQLERFLQFLKVGNLNKTKILDLGCGLGDFYEFLNQQGLTFYYTGYDIVPEFIDECKKKYPQLKFKLIDITLTPVNKKFDYVFASGVFAHANKEFFNEMIKQAFSMCKKAFVFNMYETDKEDFFQISKTEVLFQCRSLGNCDVSLIEDYLPDDYTIIVSCLP